MTPSQRSDFYLAIFLGVGAAVVYLAWPQRQIYGDGIGFLTYLESGRFRCPQISYLPTVWLVRQLLSPITTNWETALRVTSALSGAAAVAIWYMVGRRWLTRAGAACAAVTTIFLPAFWFYAVATELHTFHAAATALLMWAMVQLIPDASPDASADRRRWPLIVLGLGVALALASHLSALSSLGALAITVWFSRRRTATAIAALAGFSIFAICHYFVLRGDDHSAAYEGGFIEIYKSLATDFGRLRSVLSLGLEQQLLFTLPASVFLLAGLIALRRRASTAHALMCGAWLLGYFLLCFPLATNEFGSYYVPSCGLLAILGVLALESLSRTVLGAILLVTFATLPGLTTTLVSPTAGIISSILGQFLLLVFIIFRKTAQMASATEARLAVLPVLTCISSFAFVAHEFPDDPKLDCIESVSNFVAKDAVVLFVERNGLYDGYWRRFFELRNGSRWIENVTILDVVPAAEESTFARNLRERIESQLRAGREAWLAGDLSLIPPEAASARFVADLQTRFLLTPVTGPMAPAMRISAR